MHCSVHWIVVVVVATAACKDKPSLSPRATAPGSATTAGSATGGSATTGSAATASTRAPLVIGEPGVGPLSEIPYTDDDATLTALQRALVGYPELAVSFDVMDVGGEVEAEEGYFSVKKARKEVLQIMRPQLEGKTALEIHALDPMFATTDDIKPGDKADVLAAKRKDVACRADSDERLGFLTCVSAAEPSVVFVLDARGYKGKTKKPGKVALAALAERSILEIVR